MGKTKRWAFAAAMTGVALFTPHAMADATLAVMGGREQIRTAYERMDASQLEQVFWRCDAASSQRPLGFDEGVMCAMAWDALLARRFGGDVNAMLAWWRALRTESALAARP